VPKGAFLQKKIRKKNVNNVLAYILNKAPLPLFNYLQVRAEKCVPTKKNKKKNVNNVLVYKFKKNPFSLITSRFVPKGAFLQKKNKKKER
jgi:hypothetical protein